MREIEMLQTPDVQSSQETQMTSPKLRPGNSALNYLLAHYTTSVKLSHLVDSIPRLAAILRDEGTHKVRGVAKYAVRTQYSTVDNGDSWMFGKEVSAILTGSAKDIAYIT